LRGWASDLLDPARLRADGLLDADKVSAMWRQHVGGSFDRSTYLWNVLMFQAWHADARRDAPVRLSWPGATEAPAMVAP
jgi:asparagine synthase (glutamine-hydrolysing)